MNRNRLGSKLLSPHLMPRPTHWPLRTLRWASFISFRHQWTLVTLLRIRASKLLRMFGWLEESSMQRLMIRFPRVPLIPPFSLCKDTYYHIEWEGYSAEESAWHSYTSVFEMNHHSQACTSWKKCIHCLNCTIRSMNIWKTNVRSELYQKKVEKKGKSWESRN